MKKTTLRNLLSLTLVISLCVLFAFSVNAEEYADYSLGMTYSEQETVFRLDAPDAQSAAVVLYDSASPENEYSRLDMTKGDTTGIWYAATTDDISGYLYEFEVDSQAQPDIYSVSCVKNGTKNHVIDLADTCPDGWENDEGIVVTANMPIFRAYTADILDDDENTVDSDWLSDIVNKGYKAIVVKNIMSNYGFAPNADCFYGVDASESLVTVVKQMVKDIHDAGLGVILQNPDFGGYNVANRERINAAVEFIMNEYHLDGIYVDNLNSDYLRSVTAIAAEANPDSIVLCNAVTTYINHIKVDNTTALESLVINDAYEAEETVYVSSESPAIVSENYGGELVGTGAPEIVWDRDGNAYHFVISHAKNDTYGIYNNTTVLMKLGSSPEAYYGTDENNLTSVGTLEQAFKNVPTGGYIRLIDDINLSEPIVVTDNSFTFDLNGNTIDYDGTDSACIVADEGASIGFVDTAFSDYNPVHGTITSCSSPALEVRNGGVITVLGGKFVSHELYPVLNIAEGGKAILGNGRFDVTQESDCAILNKGELIINEALIIAYHVPACIENHGDVKYIYGNIHNDGMATFDLKNGTIDFSNSHMDYVVGITILSELNETEIKEKVTLPSDTFLKATQGENGNIYTVKSIYVAHVDYEYFTTMEDAIEYADEQGGAVVLMDDIQGFEAGATDNWVYIDLNEHNINGGDYAITVNDGANIYIYSENEGSSTISASEAIFKVNGGSLILGNNLATSSTIPDDDICVFEYHGGKIATSDLDRYYKILNKAGTVNATDIVVYKNDVIFTLDTENDTIKDLVPTLEQDGVYYTSMGAPALMKNGVSRDETTATIRLEVNYASPDGYTEYYCMAVEKGSPAPNAYELLEGEAHQIEDSEFHITIEGLTENSELDFYLLTALDTPLFDDVLFVGDIEKIEIGKNVEKYPLWIGGVQVDVNNKDDVMGDGTVSYDAENAILTLDNYIYDGSYYYVYENESGEYGAIIYTTESLTLNLKGSNVIESNTERVEGIVARSDNDQTVELVIEGDGTLDIFTNDSDAFYCKCKSFSLTICEDVLLNLRPTNGEGIYISAEHGEMIVKDNASIDIDNEDECIQLTCYGDEEECVCDHNILITDNARLYLRNTDEEGIHSSSVTGTLTVEDNANIYINVDENAIDVARFCMNGGYVNAFTEGEYTCIMISDEFIMTEGRFIAEGAVYPAVSAPYIKISGGEAEFLSSEYAIYGMIDDRIDTDDYEKQYGIYAKLYYDDEYEEFDAEYIYDYACISILPDGHYFITFDANGGKIDTNVMYTYGGKLEELPTPTRDGYDFMGWFMQSDDDEIAVTLDTVFEEDTEIYAKWSRHSVSTGATVGSVTNTTRNPDGSTTSSKYSIKDGTTTDTTKHTDGSVTVTVTEKDGSSVTTFTDTNGTVTVTEKDTDGNVYTEIKDTNGATVIINRPAEGEITIRVKTDKENEIFIPVVGAQSITKVILKNEKGETVEVSDIETNEKGVKLTVTENALVTFATEKSEEPDNETVFEDIKDHWANDAIEYVANAAIMNGVDESAFAPDENVTRAMLVTVLYRLEGEPATNRSIPFADVDMGAYYASAVNWAKQTGIVNGTSYTEFSPDDFVLREQIAAILHRYAVYKGYDVSVGENTNILSYEDIGELSEYAIAPMQYVIGSGIINGKTESTIAPQEFATRAEIATILHRFMEINK